jgi:hypothetical protein
MDSRAGVGGAQAARAESRGKSPLLRRALQALTNTLDA